MQAIVIAKDTTRARALETGFVVERYHRAFDDEIKHIRGWLRQVPGGTDELAPALDLLVKRLRAHCSFQECQLFPVFEAGLSCSPKLFDAWAMDSLRLFGSLERVSETCRSLDRRGPLFARVHHIVNEIQDHSATEAKVLAGWTGFGA